MIASRQTLLKQKRTGAYFTPEDLAGSLVAWLAPGATDRMLDPSCGDGMFLVRHRNSVGIERDPASAREAVSRAPAALVHEGDFFAWAEATAERFECAAGNPPFIRYQTFAGETRRRALAFCTRQGVFFSGLASSWAPFLVAAASLLKRGGRMAFVVPAEIGHAPYAAPLLDYLVESFSKVQVVAVRDKLFPKLSEDCWLLYAEGHGGRTDHVDLTVTDRFVPSRKLPDANVHVPVEDWRGVWSRRLRPYLLPSDVRAAYAEAVLHPDSRRLSDMASVGIGYVSGANDFFHLRPSEAKRLRIPAEVLHPSVRKARALPNVVITPATVAEWRRDDEPMLLLRLRRDHEPPQAVRRYLDSQPGRDARLGYKCRNRAPWYSVPDVQVPDFVMSYMSGRTVSLVRNAAGVTCTNSVHSVRIRDRELAASLLPTWGSPAVRLSCELEGHALGGGMLKLEPREASRVLFPAHDVGGRKVSDEALEEAVTTMQRWRHYVG